MKITEDARIYAAERSLNKKATVEEGMHQRVVELVEKGAEVYAKA